MSHPAGPEPVSLAAAAFDAIRRSTGIQDNGAVMTVLVTSLRHYADRNGIDFAAVMAASSQSYEGDRAGRPAVYPAGQEVTLRAGAVLGTSLTGTHARGIIESVQAAADGSPVYSIRFPGDNHALPFTAAELQPAPAFPSISTSRGLVLTLSQAEEQFIEAAARIRLCDHRDSQPAAADVADLHALSAVIAERHGLSEHDMTREYSDQISQRAHALRAIDAATPPGRERGPAETGVHADGLRSISPAQLAADDFPGPSPTGNPQAATRRDGRNATPPAPGRRR